MPWKYARDLMLTDLLPACASRGVIDVHKAGMKITGEGKTFVKNECHAVIAVTWSVKDFPIQPDTGKKFPAFFHFQNEISLLCNRNVGKLLAFEKFCKRRNELRLAFRKDQRYALVF